jgi:two-component system chemotaxis response regulator CheY
MSDHGHAALIVEDHDDAREALELLIEASGYTVAAVRTGAEALAHLRGGFRCCLIVLDWWLPDMNGGDLVLALAADPELAHIPTVFCTADARIRAEIETRQLPVREVHLKPLDSTQLVGMLERHCTRRSSPGSKEVA